jgi:hypothetical protein
VRRGRKIKRAMLAVVVGGALASAFGPVASATAIPPTVGSQWVSGVTPTDATLNAEINPNGLLTKYKLQLDTTGRFRFFQSDSCPLHPPGVGCAQVIVGGDPLGSGLVQPVEYSLSAGFESQHVSVNMGDIGALLQLDTTYYYRAIAANGFGFVYGPTQTFVTPSALASLGDLTPDESPALPKDGVPVTTGGSGATAGLPTDDVGRGARQRPRRAGCQVRHGRRSVRRVVRGSSSRATVRIRGRARAGCARG